MLTLTKTTDTPNAIQSPASLRAEADRLEALGRRESNPQKRDAYGIAANQLANEASGIEGDQYLADFATEHGLWQPRKRTEINGTPAMTRGEYNSHHSDYRGTVDGKPYLLRMGPNGTTYGPVIITGEAN